jgi:4-amino-4-deoxy-L-arabinose transferase-like glycosyltransferase
LQANANAHGRWFENPWPIGDPSLPKADHAPLTALVLTPVAFVVEDADSNLLAMRYVFAVLGAATVAVVGLLGREVSGDAVGWIAAGLAAIYPHLWVNDGLVMSETLAAGLSATIVLLALRLLRRPSVGLAGALGAVCGVAALARAELALFVPLLVLPAVLVARAVSRPRRAALACTALGAALLVVAPWTVFNLTRFDEPVLISTNDGVGLAGSNCDVVYHGSDLGLWNAACLPPVRGDQSVQSAEYRSQGIDYVRAHLGRFPTVVLARIGRTWSVFRPLDVLSLNALEGRPRWVSGLGLAFYYPLLALAIGGVVVLRRRHVRVWPLLVPAVVITLPALLTAGVSRYRVPAEVSIVVLAAVALVAVGHRFAGPRPAGAPADPGRDPVPVGAP